MDGGVSSGRLPLFPFVPGPKVVGTLRTIRILLLEVNPEIVGNISSSPDTTFVLNPDGVQSP